MRTFALTIIIGMRGGPDHIVMDDFAFLQKHSIFRHMPKHKPLLINMEFGVRDCVAEIIKRDEYGWNRLITDRQRITIDDLDKINVKI
jgi:hypothetical protein